MKKKEEVKKKEEMKKEVKKPMAMPVKKKK
jgi:hypothetical protein